jgi:hypothetical protein|tara:strand:- start:847 stop:1038 length:192 start_codon:yes stop_codon:yes gene_type:complete
MSINEISKWLKESGLVAMSGEDLELVKDYIDDKCIIIIPKKYYKSASLDMGTSHIEEAQKRRK